MENLILYCVCCLSNKSELFKISSDSYLIHIYKQLLGYQEDNGESYYFICKDCKYRLHKIYTFQNICRKAQYFLKNHRMSVEFNETDNQDTVFETHQTLSASLPFLQHSGVQTIDIPAEDRLLIRRRPLNIVTLPQTTESSTARDDNQIVLSFKNPIDINEDDENHSENDELMFKNDSQTLEDDSYFDFTIVVKDNVQENYCKRCKICNSKSTPSPEKSGFELDVRGKPNDSIVTTVQITDGISEDVQCPSTEGSKIVFGDKNGVIKLSLSDIAGISVDKVEMVEDEQNDVENHCSDDDVSFELKHENNIEDYEQIDQTTIDKLLDNIDIKANEIDTDHQESIKCESDLENDLSNLSATLAQLRRSKKIRRGRLKLRKRKLKLNNKGLVKKHYPCDICGLVFDLAIHLEIHNSVHTGLNSFICDLCCRAFPLKSALEKHMACHSCDRKRYKCDLCPKTFIFKKLLYKHKFKHTNETKPHVCSICSRGFVFENELKKHMLLHTDIRPFACPKCPKKFTQKAFLSQHLLTHVEGELFICDICGKGFAQNAKLSYHRKTHLEVKPYQCDLCPRSFVRSGQLKTHKIYHSNERPWICEHCGRSFRVKGALTAHKRVHSGARPYKCDICHHSYTEAGYLKKHKRIHSGIKPFSCEICGRAFNETCTLARHRLTHSDERKHVCQECGGRFKYSGCLNKHIQRKHNTTRTQS